MDQRVDGRLDYRTAFKRRKRWIHVMLIAIFPMFLGLMWAGDLGGGSERGRLLGMLVLSAIQVFVHWWAHRCPACTAWLPNDLSMTRVWFANDRLICSCGSLLQ